MGQSLDAFGAVMGKPTEMPLIFLRQAHAKAPVELVIGDRDNQVVYVLRPTQLKGIVLDGIKICLK